MLLSPRAPRALLLRRLPLRALAAGAVLALVTVPASPASAAEIVGGSQLGSTGVVVAGSSPALPDVAAASWLVADLDSGEVLAAKDPHGRFAPASTLKMLTAITLIPLLEPERRITPSFDDIAVDGSKVGLVEEVSYPVRELFSALLMVSGNDAANTLASAAGGQELVAGLMNDRAAELGALDTHAVNQHGLDAPGQLSSAYDLALIARAGLDDPDFARYVATRSSSVSAPDGARLEITNKNGLLRDYPGALGIKNGYTVAAQASFAGAAERDGRRLLVTLMNATPRVFDEAEKLLDWGFTARAALPVGALVQPEQPAAAVPDGAVPEGAVQQDADSPARTTSLAALSPAADEGTGMTVTLAGLALAAAALISVRHRRAPRPAGRAAPSSEPRPTEPRTPEPRTAQPRTPVSRTPVSRTPARQPVSATRR